MKRVRQYVVGILIGIILMLMLVASPVMLVVRPRVLMKAYDQAVNVAWFRGHPAETVSAHVGWLLARETISAPWWAHLIGIVTDWVEEDHVYKAARIREH